ncbi:unnamed protein product [Cladocopium goreaui]|uniref:DNA repair protein complementing XP-C cells (Xeroderma pigmentosum group C-complementing protein) (p125) n=1 Tax=Cladocopium goreaui TaxID=2562237 RepID=A0A9P1CCT4_9DINO|nr:unnamed protein product [Cladocopium goreaui]
MLSLCHTPGDGLAPGAQREAEASEPLEASNPQRRASAKGKAKAKAKAKVTVRAAYQRTQLLGWLAHLWYLHEACCNEFLQSVCLSSWGSPRDPQTADELFQSFRDQLNHKADDHAPLRDDDKKLSILLRACRCARRKQGRPLDLAVCFVALCRALDWPSRLVVAFDLHEPQRRLGHFFSPKKSAATPGPISDALQAFLLKDDPIEVDDEDLEEELEDVLEGDILDHAKQLIGMGFERDKVVQTMLEVQTDSEPFNKALELLLAAGESAESASSPAPPRPSKTGNMVSCEWCGQAFQKGAFCGSCGQRMREGGASGAADAGPEEDEDFLVTTWAEIFDAENNIWVAVDVAFGEIIPFPETGWLHRGTPMVWICAAGDKGYLDVTPRYSPRWWEVEQAREPSGSRQLRDWWEKLLCSLEASGGGEPEEWTALRASEAEKQDEVFLHQRRQSGGVPRTKQALKHHEIYRLGPKRATEALKPGAQPVATVQGENVYWRKDVSLLRTKKAWLFQKRRVLEGEKPFREIGEKSAKSSVRDIPESTALAVVGEDQAASRQLFGDWQTEPMEAKQKGVKRPRTSKTASGLPELPAPRKRKVNLVPLKGFEEKLQQLAKWLEDHHRLPWEKSHQPAEKRLGAWVLTAQKSFGRGTLPQEQRDALEALEHWSWGDYERDDDTHDAAEAEPAEPEAAAAEVEPPGEEDETQQTKRWQQNVIQKLQRDLEQCGADVELQRRKLQRWRLSYHPDKNYGRTEEVTPIFHFVQEKWNSLRSDAVESAPVAAPGMRRKTTMEKGHAQQRSCYTGNRSYALHIDNPHKSGGPMDLPDNGLRVTLVYYINPHWDPDSGYNGGGLDVFLTDPNSAPPSASTARKAPKLRIAPHADTLAIFLAERMAHQVVETMGKERMYCLTMWCFDQFALSNFVPQVSQKQRDMQAGSDDEY